MNFFKKNKEETEKMKITSSGKDEIASHIDQTMHIVGDISCRGTTQIDGRIEGNIEGEHLILSETAVVEGDIKASTVVCQGTLKGNIKVETFYARKPTKVEGKLETKDLSVESGATLNCEIDFSGRKEMISKPAEKEKEKEKEKKKESPPTVKTEAKP